MSIQPAMLSQVLGREEVLRAPVVLGRVIAQEEVLGAPVVLDLVHSVLIWSVGFKKRDENMLSSLVSYKSLSSLSFGLPQDVKTTFL